ncbi:Bis 5'-adenosyl triphosphatase ENPP4 [Taenia crassiceps]|uniref:Bis 5'-adenosyl triphosphatase ENPP4 n=1 Tax=Taenia crassiceps TaxID=6207 RepID=A0ABR4QAT0_9CEST
MRCAIWGQCLLLLILTYSAYCANKVLFISFDGFRHDYLDMAEKAGRNISAFKQVRESGFQAVVQNVMITLTFPSHYTMATGRYVENHGLVGNKFYDPDLQKSFSYKKPERNMESEWFEYGDAEPLWSTNERHGGRSCVFQWVGSEARVHNKMAFATSGLYNKQNPLRYRVDRIMDWISHEEFTLAMMYYNQPDSDGHRYGPESNEVMDKVEEINEALAYLLQRLEQTPSLRDRVNIVISSDHGMTRVDTSNKVIDLYKPLKDVSQYVIFDSSSATLGLWTKKKSKISSEDLFNRINGIEHLSVYYKSNIPQRYNYQKNLRIAPVFAVADNGWLISTQKKPYSNLYGMHGYDNEEPDMHPFMVAMGPDIAHFTERQHFHQVDLYPYICALLGLDKPNRIDGLIDRVVPFLKEKPSEEYLEQFRLYASGALKPNSPITSRNHIYH